MSTDTAEWPEAAAPSTIRRGRPNLRALIALVAVTAVWGSTFVVVKDVTREASPMDFLAVRFLIAAAVLAAISGAALVIRQRRQRDGSSPSLSTKAG